MNTINPKLVRLLPQHLRWISDKAISTPLKWCVCRMRKWMKKENRDRYNWECLVLACIFVFGKCHCRWSCQQLLPLTSKKCENKQLDYNSREQNETHRMNLKWEIGFKTVACVCLCLNNRWVRKCASSLILTLTYIKWALWIQFQNEFESWQENRKDA